MRHVEQILAVFAGCSNSTDNALYFPIDGVGKIVHAALSMKRKIRDLEGDNERMSRKIIELTTGEK